MIQGEYKIMGRGLDTIKKLNAVSFDWKDSKQNDVSFIAEDVAKVIPEAVFYKDGKIEGIRIVPILAIVVEAIKELAKEK